MPVTTTQLPPDLPFLTALTNHLASTQTTAPWDFSDTLIILPTTQAGRRLRETLATLAAKQNTGILPPLTLTQENLLNQNPPENIAAYPDLLATWTHTLLATDPELLQPIFPNTPPTDPAWASTLADTIIQLQSTLASNALDFATVAEKTTDTPMDPARWQTLAALEKTTDTALQQKSLLAPSQHKLNSAQTSAPPPGIHRILLANILDPLPLLATTLTRWSQSLPIEILSQSTTTTGTSTKSAPTTGNSTTTPGAAAPSAYSLLATRYSLLDGASAAAPAIRLLATTDDAATLATTIAAAYRPTGNSTLAIGILDPLAIPVLQNALLNAGISTHDPAGLPLSHSSLAKLLNTLCDLSADGSSTAPATALLRHPLYAAHLIQQNLIPDQASALNTLDETLATHLPDTLESLLAFAPSQQPRNPNLCPLRPALLKIQSTQTRLIDSANQRQFHSTLRQLLSGILDNNTGTSTDPHLPDSVKSIAPILETAAAAEQRHPAPLHLSIWLNSLRRQLDQARLNTPRPPDAIDLQGWSDLPFEDAPHLLLVGFNEDHIPKKNPPSSFLPESLRRHLHLPTNEDHYARDHHALANLLNSRTQTGRIDILVPRHNAAGDPLFPSRLLFSASDADFIDRATTLLKPPAPLAPPPARTIPWKLSTAGATETFPKHFSASAIKNYLACPTRYYLSNILKMDPVPVLKSEMDALDFGNLIHDTLHHFIQDTGNSPLSDEHQISKVLESLLLAQARRNYGSDPAFAVRIQIESALARLRAFARIETEQRADGWSTIATEQKWEMQVQGHTFTGRIDRIDKNTRTGALRVIDYKTFETAKTPEQTHTAGLPKNHDHILPQSIFTEIDDGSSTTKKRPRQRRWTDLQLPLYLLALRATHGNTPATAAYITLAKTSQDTRLIEWDTLTLEQIAHAEQCALAAATAITNRRFWPPAPKSSFNDDPLEALFPDGLPFNLSKPE